MLPQYLVRVGLLGHVGRFTSVDAVSYARGANVVCRTRRGLEIGEVLAEAEERSFDADGALLRRLSVEDHLLAARLRSKQDEAFAACTRLLAEQAPEAVLVDVEHLFDGRSLYFYFLGGVTPELAELTESLAAEYDSTVRFRQFADALEHGCGPGCGTAEAEGAGCGTGGCSSCAVSSACGTKHS